MLTRNEIIGVFTEFFVDRGHKLVGSSSLVPKDDPTLLFTSAGMVQFKPYWSGDIPLPFKRAVSVQKCLRLSDIDEVGKSPMHDTFFEMLGNFSFGDYFKGEAIAWGWEFLTKILNIPENKLWITVYPEDEESYNIWKNQIGIPEFRIVKLKDNFWGPAGGTGACGPDTEIYYDRGEEYGAKLVPGNEGNRFIEVWNIVFPQFNQLKDGTRTELKNRGVDTGMGMERLMMILEEKESIFDTTLFYPIIEETQRISGVPYQKNVPAYRIISDHIRAIAFAICDGVYPSNEGRGYVVRRLLRRATIAGKKIGIEQPFLYTLSGEVVSRMKDVYPELGEKEEEIGIIVKSEEERFLRTMKDGLRIFTDILEKQKSKGNNIIMGDDVFLLYDTYGFPLELTEEFATLNGFKIDKEGYEQYLNQQRKRAKEKSGFKNENKAPWNIIIECKSQFVRDRMETKTEIIAYREQGKKVEVILKETPFYAEMGGQIGDKGIIEGAAFKIYVEDTYPSPMGNVHSGKMQGRFHSGSVSAVIDKKRRLSIMKNHTATHLLHAALRRILGTHIRQRGSYVGDTYFRFDFTHPEGLTEREIRQIEELVNEKIAVSLPVEIEEMPYQKAVEKGALAFFGEKYGDVVRVVKIGDFSMELCGGTHIDNTGLIGIFKIRSEFSVAAGIRRIEALTGNHARQYLNTVEEKALGAARLLNTSLNKLPEITEKMVNRLKDSEKRIQELENKIAEKMGKDILQSKKKIKNIGFIKVEIDENPELLRKIAAKLRMETNTIGVLVSRKGEGIYIITFSSDEIKEKFPARRIANIVGKIFNGGGGGRNEIGEAGAKTDKDFQKKYDKIEDKLYEEFFYQS